MVKKINYVCDMCDTEVAESHPETTVTFDSRNPGMLSGEYHICKDCSALLHKVMTGEELTTAESEKVKKGKKKP